MNGAKQKLLIENLLSSSDVFSRCVGILNAEFFEPEYKPIIRFLIEYFNKYHNVPTPDTVNAEFDSQNFKTRQITFDELAYTCDQVEKFCQEEALVAAILASTEDITSGDRKRFGKVEERIRTALSISLQRDMGIDMFENIGETLRGLVESFVYHPTGIKGLDDALDGGLVRQQFTLFSANSGVGKSIMMANLGANYAYQGKHVLKISLELPEGMIAIRNSSIMTGLNIKNWKENIPAIEEHINGRANGGSYRIKRLPVASTANDIRAYLKHYELEYKRRPDVLIIDYLDLMQPIGGNKQLSVSEQDKLKSEQVAEILIEYNMIGISASQQNREALRTAAPDQGVIAGGISKVNTVDNYISMYMDPTMRVKGEMLLFFLKTRSSSAVGSSVMVRFNAENLQITDSKTSNINVYIPTSKKKLHEELTKSDITELPERLDDTVEVSHDDLIKLMNSFN